MDDNIIQFPKLKIVNAAQSAEELEQKIQDYKEEYASEVSEFIWRNVIGELVRSGCDFSDMKKFFPPMMLILESIRSLHLQSQGIHHNLQDFAVEAISFEDLEDFEEKMVDIDDELD